jgi:hypothetical protein
MSSKCMKWPCIHLVYWPSSTILVFIWFQELSYQIGAFQGITKWSWPNVKIITTTGVYFTRGPSGPNPRPSRPRGRPASQLNSFTSQPGFEAVRPEPWFHASTWGGGARVGRESQWRPLHPVARPCGLAARQHIAPNRPLHVGGAPKVVSEISELLYLYLSL